MIDSQDLTQEEVTTLCKHIGIQSIKEYFQKNIRAPLKTSPFAFLRKAKGLCVGLRPTPPPLKT